MNEHLLKPLGDWIRQPPLPHLTLRLRFTAVGVTDAAATLTLFGLLLPGEFRVRAAWTGGLENSALAEHAPTADEALLLEHLQHYLEVDRHIAGERMPGARWSRIPCRYTLESEAAAAGVLEKLRRLTGNKGGSLAGSTVSVTASVAELAQAITETRRPRQLVVPLTRRQERCAHQLVWLLFGDQQRRSLSDFHRRLSVMILATSIGWLGAHYLAGLVHWLFLALAVGSALGTLWILAYHAVILRMYKTQMSRGLRETAHRPAGIVEVSFEDAGLANDPAVRKHSIDLVDAGGVLHAEIRLESVKTLTGANRIYLFPDDATVFSLCAMTGLPKQSIFPARVTFHLETRFTDGLRLVSANLGMGYRKPLPSSRHIPRYWPEARTAPTILRQHRAVIQRLIREGRQLAPLDPADILPRMDREHGSDRVERDQVGWYSWSDAGHEVFDRVRPEYREARC